jgi:signal transduction histidine kinase
MITMGMVTVVMERHQHDAILEQTRLRALALAHSLAALCESYLLSYNFFKLEQIAEKVTDDDADVLYAVIHLHDGSIATFSRRDDLQGTQPTDPVSLRAIQTTAPLVQERLGVETTAHGYDVALPVFVPPGSKKWGTIRLGFSLQQAYERIDQTRRALFWLSLGAIIGGTFLAILLAMWVSRPIGQLVAGAQAFARGAYDQPIRVNASDELGYLARTFEQMMHEISHDMAERKRLEAQLHQAQKMEAIGTMAGGIAHDFNNILGAILGFTELASYDLPLNSPVRKNLQEVLTAGTRAKDLVRQILTFSRQHEQARQPLYLHVVAQEVLRLLHASLPSTISIQQYLTKVAGMVLADPTQMHQVLLNLCANAEYAMRDTGGILEVRVYAVEVDAALAAQYPALHLGPHVCLSVRDTGPGIPLEVRARIFDPFFTTKPIGEGTGMGLRRLGAARRVQ